MNRRVFSLFAVGAALAVATPSFAADGQKFTTRGIIRAGVDNSGRVHGELAKLTGLANATSINYKVLLLEADGKERFVNESDTTFKFGQQFRLAIESDTDLYLYVFHEGPDSVRTILMPDSADQGRIPMVKKGQTKIIPDDGTYFEFVPPAGTERVLVYATPEKRPQLTPEEAFSPAKSGGDKKQLELKSKQDKVFGDASNKGPMKTIKATDIKQVAQSNEELPEFRLRGLRWEPEPEEGAPAATEGKTVFVGTYEKDKRPDLFVEISLKTQ